MFLVGAFFPPDFSIQYATGYKLILRNSTDRSLNITQEKVSVQKHRYRGSVVSRY